MQLLGLLSGTADGVSEESVPLGCELLEGRCGLGHLQQVVLGGENAWMDGCMDGWMHGWMHGRMDGRTDGWMDGWMDGRTNGWMDKWMDGRTEYG